MTLELAFHELDTRLAELQQSFDNLLWAVVQGQGSGWSHAVLDHYDAAVHDAVGLLHEGRAAAVWSDGQPDLVQLRSALVTIQEQFNALLICFYTQLTSFDRKTTLYSLRRKGRAWKTWINGVDDALDQCPQRLYAVSLSLLRCWQELVDRANFLCVSAQLNSIGTGKIAIEGGARTGQPDLAVSDALKDSMV